MARKASGSFPVYNRSSATSCQGSQPFFVIVNAGLLKNLQEYTTLMMTNEEKANQMLDGFTVYGIQIYKSIARKHGYRFAIIKEDLMEAKKVILAAYQKAEERLQKEDGSMSCNKLEKSLAR